jgi:hypothetical protein
VAKGANPQNACIYCQEMAKATGHKLVFIANKWKKLLVISLHLLPRNGKSYWS